VVKSCQGIHHEVGKNWGEMFPLTYLPSISKVRANLSIDIYGRLSPRDQLHGVAQCQLRSPFSVAPRAGTQVHSLIGLLEIKYQQKTFEFLNSEFMSNLMMCQHALVQATTFNEGRLTSINHPMGYWGSLVE
jgi:hypothetical protein